MVGDATIADVLTQASLPPELQALEPLSRNLWWCWNGVESVFSQLDASAWASSRSNPVTMLQTLGEGSLRRAAKDADYLGRLVRARSRLDAELQAAASKPRVLYLCAEYALHESLPIYSGGLGVLAGDHLKSASDLKLPLVAVGLFYRRGFMTQGVEQGQQKALSVDNDPSRLPVERVLDAQGQTLSFELPFAEKHGGSIRVEAYRVRVGAVDLYLLDTQSASNSEYGRQLTERLYPAQPELRLGQELLLGVGGVRLMQALGHDLASFLAVHLNEGHAAFAGPTLAQAMGGGDSGIAAARERCCFTTHTPVPAGHDRFDPRLLRSVIGEASAWFGIDSSTLITKGQVGVPPEEGMQEEAFNMSHLALSYAERVNGVSDLHAEVSRELLKEAFPGTPVPEIPIFGITNGVHLPTWIAPEIQAALAGEERVKGEHFGEPLRRLSDAQLWDLRQQIRARGWQGFASRGVPATQGEPPLTIGFARRFAAYKRAHLMLSQPERLARLLGDPQRPVRILVAGKAHPADTRGQAIMAKIVAAASVEPLRGKIHFLPNYEMDLGRLLTQGVDVWLNNPIRGLEASGTSGMKAASNGAPNLSISDGWWEEGARADNGWTIPSSEEREDEDQRDADEAEALYRLLEEQVVPDFYAEREADVPKAWVARVRASMASVAPIYDSVRMVREYAEKSYRLG